MRFVKIGALVVVVVILVMMALSAFTVRVPLSSVTTTTVGDTTVTTRCSWLDATPDDWHGCTTTRVRISEQK